MTYMAGQAPEAPRAPIPDRGAFSFSSTDSQIIGALATRLSAAGILQGQIRIVFGENEQEIVSGSAVDVDIFTKEAGSLLPLVDDLRQTGSSEDEVVTAVYGILDLKFPLSGTDEESLSPDELRELNEAQERYDRVKALLGYLPERWEDMEAALAELRRYDEEHGK